mgnify:FL=1
MTDEEHADIRGILNSINEAPTPTIRQMTYRIVWLWVKRAEVRVEAKTRAAFMKGVIRHGAVRS